MRPLIAFSLITMGCSNAIPTKPVVVEVEKEKTTITIPNPAVKVEVADKTADMTYKDLLVLLRNKGFTVHMAPAGSDHVYLFNGNQTEASQYASVLAEQDFLYANCLAIRKHNSLKSSKEYAGSVETGIVQWGQFTINSRPRQPDVKEGDPERRFTLMNDVLKKLTQQ